MKTYFAALARNRRLRCSARSLALMQPGEGQTVPSPSNAEERIKSMEDPTNESLL